MLRGSGRTVTMARGAVVLGWLLLVVCGCSRREKPAKAEPRPAGPLERVTICQGGILPLLSQVALDRGFFAAEGLAAELTTYGDGKLAMEALLSGACTASTVGEPPIVSQSLVRDDFVVLASVASSENATKILARRDRGILAPGDLAGKRVGVRQGTISQMFLAMFLAKHRIDSGKVSVRYMDLKEMPHALAAGEIDAFSASDTYFVEGQRLMGDRAITFSEPGLCYNSLNLVAMRNLVASNPETVRRILRALQRAETFAAANPGAAREIMAKARSLPPDDLKVILADQRDQLSLDQPMILSFEANAHWKRDNELPGISLPNYLHFIDPEPLRQVKPAAVTLAR